jgi:hypothetical protein
MHGRETDFNQFPFLEVIDPGVVDVKCDLHTEA